MALMAMLQLPTAEWPKGEIFISDHIEGFSPSKANTKWSVLYLASGRQVIVLMDAQALVDFLNNPTTP